MLLKTYILSRKNIISHFLLTYLQYKSKHIYYQTIMMEGLQSITLNSLQNQFIFLIQIYSQCSLIVQSFEMQQRSKRLEVRHNFHNLIDQQYSIIRRKVSHSMTVKLIKQSKICFKSNKKAALLIEPITSSSESSYSFLLSMAEFLNSQNTLSLPTVKSISRGKRECNAKTGKFQMQKKNDEMEPWCDYLFSLLSQQNILVMDDVVVFVGVVSDQFLQQIEETVLFRTRPHTMSLQQKMTKQDLSHIFEINYPKTNDPICIKKIGIINFSTSILNQDHLKPKIHLEGLISGILFNDGDQWRSFRILKQDIPTLSELLQYNTIILSGSSYSVNNIPEEFQQFKKILSKALQINSKLKVLGICFGHQFVAHINGVEVTSKPLNKGPENINFSAETLKETLPFLTELTSADFQTLRLYKYHHDHVTAAPRGFIKFGQSQKCQVQSLLSQDKRIFTFQFHPQFTEEYIAQFERRWNHYHNHEQKKTVISKFDAFHHKSLQKFRKSLRKFINWEN